MERTLCVLDSYYLDVGFEAFHLASECIAFYRDVHKPQKRLPALGIAREEDRPGARPPNGLGRAQLSDGLDQTVGLRQFSDRRRLAAWNDQPVQPFKV